MKSIVFRQAENVKALLVVAVFFVLVVVESHHRIGMEFIVMTFLLASRIRRSFLEEWNLYLKLPVSRRSVVNALYVSQLAVVAFLLLVTLTTLFLFKVPITTGVLAGMLFNGMLSCLVIGLYDFLMTNVRNDQSWRSVFTIFVLIGVASFLTDTVTDVLRALPVMGAGALAALSVSRARLLKYL